MTDTIISSQLEQCLETRPGIEILSLDCFDTLLWRDTHAPRDVFRALDDTTAFQRRWAEERARTAQLIRSQRSEVRIDQIYATLLPNAAPEERLAQADAERAAEAAHCFGFAPTIALMRRAKAAGLKIVIVSDTYLDRDQLATLIADAAGPDVAGLIDRIYCSSAYGLSKADGLFGSVLKDLRIRPQKILHIGDNRAADLEAARKAGLNALHLEQFTAETPQRLRLEALVGTMIHAGGGPHDLAYQPHRATLSVGEAGQPDPATALGYGVIGPVMRGFVDWLQHEAEALAERSDGRVHMMFLMRDGALPRRVHGTVFATPSTEIEISRFTATAASFVDEQAVMAFLESEITSDIRTVLGELLLEPAEIDRLLARLPAKGRLSAAITALRAPAVMGKILARSARFADRLIDYLQQQVNPAPGDTLLLVDLGYNGTVQNMIDGLLRRRLGVTTAGRYLILRELERAGGDKAGFIDHRHYDGDTLDALCGNVAVLEQICSVAQGSVIDYAAGKAVRGPLSIKGRQSATRDLIQAGCVSFARDHGAAIVRIADAHGEEAQRRGAVAALARLMFLPLASELAVLASFDHDVNLGTAATVPLFDSALAERALRQRGLFYLKGAERMYLPGELRGQGLASSLTLLTQRRFGLDLRRADFCDRSVTMPLLVADGRTVTNSHVVATPTHEGFFAAIIPIGNARFTIGVQFGRLYDWVQIDSVRFLPADMLTDDRPIQPDDEIAAQPTLEGITQMATGLFRCDDAGAFMLVPPPVDAAGRPMALAVVFRPIAARDPAPVTGPVRLETVSGN